jgi:hypothetical protein
MISESFNLPNIKNSANESTANWILTHYYLSNDLGKISNNYYLNELETRSKHNNINKELILFNQPLSFSWSKIKISNSFKSEKRKNLTNKLSQSKKNHKSLEELNLSKLIKNSKKKSEKYYIRKRNQSWPTCENDLLQLYHIKKRFYFKNKNNRSKTHKLDVLYENDYKAGFVYRV